MNRHLKVSLALAALSLTTVSLLTGCGSTTELEDKVDKNFADQQASIRDSIKTAENNLAAAKTELQALVASGDEASAEALTKAIAELNSAIEAAKKLATDSDAANKTELLAKIEEAKLFAIDASATSLEAAKKELEESIVRGDLATAETISQAVATLQEAIKSANLVASDADAALKAELVAAIEAVKKEAVDAVSATIQSSTTELKALIEAGDAQSSLDIDNAVTELRNAIEIAKAFALESDDALKAELMEAINASKLEATQAISNGIDAATKELEAKLAAGHDATLAEINVAIENVNKSIEQAKKFATDSDLVLKTELLDAIEAGKTASAAYVDESLDVMAALLRKEIADGDTTSAAKVDKVVADLTAAINAAKVFATDSDNALKADLESKIASAKAEIAESLTALHSEILKDVDAKIAAGEAVNTSAIASAVEAMNASIEAAKKFAAEADATLKADLEAKIEQSKKDVATTMQAALDAAVADLNAKIEAGALASSEALASEVESLKALIDAAKVVAGEADAALKVELEAAIATAKTEVATTMQAALDAAVAELNAKIEAGALASSEALASEVESLKALIDAAKVVAGEADAALKVELETAIATAKTDVLEVVQGKLDTLVNDFNVKLEELENGTATNLEVAIQDVKTLIAELRQFAVDADTQSANAFNERLDSVEAQIASNLSNAINELKVELEEALSSHAEDSATALENAVNNLTAAIEAAKTFAADADVELKAELEATITSVKLEILTSVEDKLAELESKMTSALESSKSDIENVLNELNTTIETINRLYNEADDALRTELNANIADAKSAAIEAAAEALASARAELEELITNSNETNASNLASAKTELELKIAEVKELCDKLAENGATTEYVDNAISTLQNSLTEAINAVRDASIQLEDWNAATEGIFGVDGGFAKLDEIYQTYKNKENTYVTGDFAKVTALYNEYWVRLVRATSVEDISNILANFDEEASKIRTVPDAIYDAIMKVGASVEDVEYNPATQAGLAYVYVLLDQAAALNNSEVDAAILAYGDDAINLQALYESYVDQYNALLRKSNGQAIKDRMDVVLSNPIVWDDGTSVDSIKVVLETIRADYNTWISDPQNALANVDGFAETYAGFVEAELRYNALVAAKVESTTINNQMETLYAQIVENGATLANRDALVELNNAYNRWISTYFADEYASEINASENYEMMNHAKMAELNELFNAKVEAFKAAAAVFADAVDAIGDVNLLSWDEINNALTEYGKLVVSRDLNDYNYMFNDQSDTPASYYDKLVNLYAEYRTLKTAANNDYIAAFTPVNGLVVSIYDADKVAAIVNWYETYGVKDADGNITFDNGEVGTGYVLSSSLIVDASDYAKIVELKANFDALVEDKLAETADVMAKIDAIGTVTVARDSYIASVRRAYEAWINGTNVDSAFIADQYKINLGDDTYVVENYDVLLEAETNLANLKAELSHVHAYINALKSAVSYKDFTNVDAKNAYCEQLKTAREMIAAFIEHNNGSDEGFITTAEYAKLHAGEVATVKFDQAMYIIDTCDSLKGTFDAYDIDAADKDYLVGLVGKVRTDALAAVDAATEVEAIDAEVQLFNSKVSSIASAIVTYETYVMALEVDGILTPEEKTDLAFRMSLSFETTLNRVADSDSVENVELNAKFVESELESLYSLPKYE